MTKGNAIVTGSARGIGKAIAIRLAQDGFNVVINDIAAMEAEGTATAAEVAKLGVKSFFVAGDVSKGSDVTNLVAKTVETLGSLSVMVANAGIAHVKPLIETTEEDWDRMLGVNSRGVFNCYQAAAKQYIKQGTPGKIIGGASIVAFRPFPYLGPYSVSKWAVRGLTQACAMEWGKHKINVNAYAPGIVDTPMWEYIDDMLGKDTGAAKGETMNKYVKELTALGRCSVPDDVAKLVSFLASPDSDFVTGQTMLVDGGIQFS